MVSVSNHQTPTKTLPTVILSAQSFPLGILFSQMFTVILAYMLKYFIEMKPYKFRFRRCSYTECMGNPVINVKKMCYYRICVIGYLPDLADTVHQDELKDSFALDFHLASMKI